MNESGILFHENGYSVRKAGRNRFTICVEGGPVAIEFEAYDDESLAMARGRYLAKRDNAAAVFAKLENDMRAG